MQPKMWEAETGVPKLLGIQAPLGLGELGMELGDPQAEDDDEPGAVGMGNSGLAHW